jgi:CRP-like cAMP-binding protein
MKIENEIIKFTQDAEKILKLSSLQKQYYAELKLQSSIFSLVKQAGQRGWLINFKELYSLVNQCVKAKIISNKNVCDYFESIELARNKSAAVLAHDSKHEKSESIDQKILVHLKNSSFFRSIADDIFSELTHDAQFIHFKTDQIICKENNLDRDLYYLYSGQVGVFKTIDGKKRFVSLLNEGTVFGETGFFLGHQRTADLIALKETRVIKINFRSDFMSEVLNQEKANSIIQRFWVQHALVNSEIFKKLPADCFDSLASVGEVKKIKNQSTIFSQNDIGDRAYCVIQGTLAVIKDDKHIQTLNQGAFFGELALIVSGGRRTATVVCTSDVVVLEVPQTQFYQLLAANLYLAKEIQTIAEERMRRDQLRKAG